MRVLIFSHSHIRRDPRLIRQIEWLRRIGFTEITTIGLGSKPGNISKHLEIPRMGLFRRIFGYLIPSNKLRFKYFYGRFLDAVWQELPKNQQLIVVNGIEYLNWDKFHQTSLSETPLYLDIHEDHLRPAFKGILEKIAFRKYWEWQLRNLSRIVRNHQGNKILTSVEPNLAREYESFTGHPVSVIMNSPGINDFKPRKLDPSNIKLVHHGMGTRGRGIEETIFSLRQLRDNYTLDLILFPTPFFSLKLQVLISILGLRDRVKIKKGVPLKELPELLNNYDISVILLSDRIPGHLNSLPNKFFESIHSGIGVVSGPNPTMAKIINEEQIGRVLKDWSKKELVSCLNAMSPEEIFQFKENAKKSSSKYSEIQSGAIFEELILKIVSI